MARDSTGAAASWKMVHVRWYMKNGALRIFPRSNCAFQPWPGHMSGVAVPMSEQVVVSAPTTARRWWALAVLCLSVLLVVVDNTIVNVALPTLSRELNASTSDLQWFVDAYTLLFAGLLLTGGGLGDRWGRKPVLQAGLVLFGLTSLWAASSSSTGELIAARAGMGVSAAVVYPATLALLSSIFTERGERATAIGIWSAVSGLAVVIGPVSGGALLQHFSWHSVFLVNIPLIVVALAASVRLLPNSRDEKPVPLRHRWRAVDGFLDRTAGMDSHRGPRSRLALAANAGGARRRGRTHHGVYLVGRTPGESATGYSGVPQPAHLRGEHSHRRGILRVVRLCLPDHPVPSIRARVQPPAGWSRHCALRARDGQPCPRCRFC